MNRLNCDFYRSCRLESVADRMVPKAFASKCHRMSCHAFNVGLLILMMRTCSNWGIICALYWYRNKLTAAPDSFSNNYAIVIPWTLLFDNSAGMISDCESDVTHTQPLASGVSPLLWHQHYPLVPHLLQISSSTSCSNYWVIWSHSKYNFGCFPWCMLGPWIN